MQITGPQLKTLAYQLLKFDKEGIVPQSIDNTDNFAILIVTGENKGIEYYISRNGMLNVSPY